MKENKGVAILSETEAGIMEAIRGIAVPYIRDGVPLSVVLSAIRLSARELEDNIAAAIAHEAHKKMQQGIQVAPANLKLHNRNGGMP